MRLRTKGSLRESVQHTSAAIARRLVSFVVILAGILASGQHVSAQQAATPTFSPAAGTYTSSQTIAISDATPGATIYFALDGATPTTSSAVYSGPILVSSTETIEAIAVAAGYSQSALASAAYTINQAPPAAIPMVSPVSGTYSSSFGAVVTDDTPGAGFYFTTDGSTPSTSSILYTNPIPISSNATIKVIAVAAGYSPSPVVTVRYTIANGPTITELSPVAGSVGTVVTIRGGGFGTSGGTVTFNGVNAATTSWGDQSISVAVPSGASTGPVVVTNSQGTSNGVTFAIGTGISGIAPSVGAVGTVVVISGSGFGATQGSSGVSFGNVPATPTSWSDSSIAVAVPTGAETANVVLQIGGTPLVGPTFTLTPSIASLSPSSGPIGASVTISGNNFGAVQGNSSVTFGAIPALPTQWSQGKIVVPVPVGAVSGSVVVTVNSQASNGSSFTVGSAVTGAIGGTITQSDGITPVAGASVTVLAGTNPLGGTTTAADGTYTIASLPAATYNLQANAAGFGTGAESGVVVTGGQTATANIALTSQRIISYTYDKNGRLTTVADSASGSSATYTYDPVGNITSIARSGTAQLSILGFSPMSGPLGTQITLSGTGFASIPSQNTVTVGGINASVLSGTPTQLVVTIPSSAISGLINVTNTNGSATSSASFTVTSAGSSAGPSISSFTPTAGNPGTVVSISGSVFDPNPANDLVSFSGNQASVVSATATSITVAVPAGAASGPITVETPMGRAVSGTIFSAIPAGYTLSNVDFQTQLGIGQSYTGTVSAGNVGIAIFSANAGQEINLTISNATLYSHISILTPDGSPMVRKEGTTGYSGGIYNLYSGSAPATGYYTVLVEASISGSLTISLSTNGTGTIAPGTATSVSIGLPGQSVALTFSGTAGQSASVQLTNSTFPCETLLTILSPDGVSLGGTVIGCPSLIAGPIPLPVTGTYSVLISAQNGAGSATATLFLLNPPTPVNISPSIPVGVTINTPGQSALLNFSGTAGQFASIQLSNSTFDSFIQGSIVSPDGTTLGGFSSSFGPISLPANGTYTIVLAPNLGGTGTVTVTLSLSAQPGNILNAGTPANVTIDTAGQNAEFIFTGTAGQYASAMLSQSTFSNQTALSILNSQGSTLASATGNFLGPMLLQGNDTYTLVIAPGGGGTGSATITLSLSSSQSGGSVSSGTLVPFTISAAGQSIQYTFTGTANQLVSVEVPSQPFPDGELIAITNPDGSQLASNYGYSNLIGPTSLPVNGTYTLTVAPQNEDTGTANLILWLFANQTGLSISPATPVGVNISIPGQNVQFTFAGTAGQTVSAQLSNITFTDQVTISILNPDGTTLSTNYQGGGNIPPYGLLPAPLPQTGTYTMVVAPMNESTGSAIVTLSQQ